MSSELNSEIRVSHTPKIQEGSMAYAEEIVLRDGHFNTDEQNNIAKVMTATESGNVPSWLRELHGQWETEINEVMPENKRKWFQKQANLLSESGSTSSNASQTSDPIVEVPDSDSDTDSVATDFDLVSVSSEESNASRFLRHNDPSAHHQVNTNNQKQTKTKGHQRSHTHHHHPTAHQQPPHVTSLTVASALSSDMSSSSSQPLPPSSKPTHRLSSSQSAINLHDPETFSQRRYTTPAGQTASDLATLLQPIKQPESSYKKSRVQKIIGGLFSRKDKGRIQFQTYSHALKAALARHEKNLFKNQVERKKLAKTMKAEIRKWKKFGIVKLETAAQTLYETSLLEMQTCRDVELKYCEVLTEKINGVQMVLDGKPISEVPELELTTDGKFVDPEDVQLPREYMPLVESLKSMKDVIHELTQRYLALQKSELRQVPFEERKKKIEDILFLAYEHRERTAQVSAKNCFHYHLPDDRGSQVDFNSLMIDERQFEGKLLKRWRRLMAGSESGVSATAVKTFIDYMIITIVTTYELKDDLKPTLQLMLNRLIFPRIAPVWLALRSPKEVEQDKCFWKKIGWLKHLSQTQLGIEEQFQCDVSDLAPEEFESEDQMNENFIWPGFPYYDAIVALSELRQYCVPEDMLHCLLLAIRLIHSCAKRYANNESVIISADSLFPLIVWTTIHAHLHDVNMAIGHLERFLKDDVKYFGEVGICLSLIEAAVVFINQRKPSNYNLPPEIEEKPTVLDQTSLYTLPARLIAEKEELNSSSTTSEKNGESSTRGDTSPSLNARSAPLSRKGTALPGTTQTTLRDASELDSILGRTPAACGGSDSINTLLSPELEYLKPVKDFTQSSTDSKSESQSPTSSSDKNVTISPPLSPPKISIPPQSSSTTSTTSSPHKQSYSLSGSRHRRTVSTTSSGQYSAVSKTPVWSASNTPVTPHTIVVICRRAIKPLVSPAVTSRPSLVHSSSSPTSNNPLQNTKPLQSSREKSKHHHHNGPSNGSNGLEFKSEEPTLELTEEDFLALYSPIGEIADIEVEASSSNFLFRSFITFMNAGDAARAVFETREERKLRIENLSLQSFNGEETDLRWNHLTFSVKFCDSMRTLPRRSRKACSIRFSELDIDKILDSVSSGDLTPTLSVYGSPRPGDKNNRKRSHSVPSSDVFPFGPEYSSNHPQHHTNDDFLSSRGSKNEVHNGQICASRSVVVESHSILLEGEEEDVFQNKRVDI